MAEVLATMVVGPLVSMLKDKASSYLLDQYKPPMPKDWRQTESNIIDHQEIASKYRGKEKEEVVNKLIGDQVSDSQLMVLPIVGMGGLGKTTLAQLVYNDPGVKKHFQLQLWVCVSDNFEVDLVAKSIVEAKAKEKSNSDKSEKSPLGSSSDKSEKSQLDRLKEAVSGKRYLLVLDDVWNRDANKWGKLKSCLQHGSNGSAVLTTTRDQVVAKLMGTTDEPYSITGLHEDSIKEIIEARAFGSKKERDAKLVEMVGAIAKRCAGSPLAATAVGSLLRTKASVQEWKASSMGTECATIFTEPSQSEKFPYSARHLFISDDVPETTLNGCLEKGSMAVQTLIYDGHAYEYLKHLSKYRSIHALRINRGSFLKPKYLHQLRYLDLSNSNFIKALPEEISILYNLQTLDLSYCGNLRQLPKEIKYMTALRHGCEKLKSMPSEFGRLTSLQTLTCFVAGTGSGCSNVRELCQLDQLGGPLDLSQLENVIEADAKAADLGNKKELSRLTLRWTSSLEKEEEEQDNHKVLEALKPHDALKVLGIYGNSRGTYPTWMNTLQQMVKFTLSDCEKLKELPPLWRLPALQVLELWRLQSLSCLCSGDAPVTPFKELKELSLDRMLNFETWWFLNNKVQGEEPIFSQLESIAFSKQLDTSMMLTSAQGVAAAQDDKSALIPGSGSCSDATASTPVAKLSSSTKHHFLPCLEYLDISSDCDGLSEILDLPLSIKTLKFKQCSKLQTLSGQLDAVQKLKICGLLELEITGTFLSRARNAGKAPSLQLRKPGVLTKRASSILISQVSYYHYHVLSWYKVTSQEPTATTG
ncbi:unnamed protein product [Miscanthus lutarioriparius]|uniref:NB-ARC domain-containing protein n=1 Tax=Miscanthus lutarioriparius TaxID=422564 RepID=A0A811RJC5_9POAL|nr:unnamed protein product [Miscanthus lutarioriparius]